MASTRIATSMIAALALACTPGAGDDEASSSTSEASTETGGSTTSTDPTDPTGTTASTDPTGTTASTDPSDSTLDGTTATPACELPPVEQTVLDQLYIAAGQTGYVPAGGDTPLWLQWIDDGFPTQVEACVEWSLDPVDGVTIDDAGVLTIDASVPTGTLLSVTADVEAGRRILTADFEVYVPLAYDILGFWTEVEQLSCGGGLTFTPDPIIGELVFQNTGEFSVTWQPFEVYYDYWGTFTYDEGTSALVLTVEGGNYVPDDIDGEGTAMVMDGQLVLQDMWLGVAQDPVTPVACGHVFE